MYERFFGLADAPFRLTPDPRYLYLSRKHAEALAHLRLGLTEANGFVCITGDVGTGKTTLLRAFLAGLGPEVSSAYIFNPMLSRLELLRRINREFGLPASSSSQMKLVDTLNDHLLVERTKGRLAVVVIDEAQALSVELLEQLRLLSNLETATEKLLRIVLVGQPQLRALLLDPGLIQLNQRITLRWHMGPLSYRETKGYVGHRLRVARNLSTRLFTAPALWLLHHRARGVPRLINMLAHRALLSAYARQEGTVTARAVRRAYREILAVPLPGARSATRRAAWVTAALAVTVGTATLGVPHVASWPEIAALVRDEWSRAVAPAPVPLPSEVSAGAFEPAPATSTAELESQLAAVESRASVHHAVDAVLDTWRERPLDVGELASLDDLESVARRRRLEVLPLIGNRSMLFLLDLPAIVELRVPGVTAPRWIALISMNDRSAVVGIGGRRVVVDASFLDRFWFGSARLLWRDFESLGDLFGRGAHGPVVARMQALLRRAGAYGGEVHGRYDDATAAAVFDFQRSHLLVVDGVVGRLTRIVLYSAAGGYPRPTLAPASGGPS